MTYDDNASVNPPPPGQLQSICVPCQSRGWALANLARSGGRAFDYPGATPGLLTRTWFPTRNPNIEAFIGKDQQFVADWLVHLGLDKIVKVFLMLCISSLLIKLIIAYKLELSLYIARSGTVNVNRRTHASLARTD